MPTQWEPLYKNKLQYKDNILYRVGRIIVGAVAMIAGPLLLLVGATLVLGGPLPPYNLRCESNLVGFSGEKLRQINKQMLVAVDTPNPVLSWTTRHTEKGAAQSAFQVVVYKDIGLSKVFWDSGKIYNEDKTTLEYEGPPLRTGKTYFWKVYWWDHKEERAVSEETGHFLVSVLDENQWDGADWIAAGDEVTTSPYLYKLFSINSSAVTEAVLHVSGLGFSRPFVNGVDLNAMYDPPIAFTPGWTNYELLVPYTVYDITSIVNKTDRLMIGVWLGRGWRNTDDYNLKDSATLAAKDTTECVLKVLVTINGNDSSTNLVSDETWKSSESNISYNSIYNGETYGFSKPHTLKGDINVKVVAGPNGTLYLPKIPYMAEVEVQKPVNVYSMYDDRGFTISQIVDFGVNNPGYCQVFNDYETSFEISHAEVAMHEPYGKADGSLYYGNLRGAEATDVYLGDSNFTYKPSFTYHGFRYAELKGFRSLALTEKHIKKIVVNSNIKRSSKFESSLPILNTLYDACVRSQQANLMSVITDCCQRNERLGWLGDAGLSAESLSLNFDMQAFFLNTLKLIQSEMVDGTIPDVVPFYRYGSRPADPSWSAAYPEILYRTLKQDKHFHGALDFFKSALDYIATTAETIPDDDITKMPNCYYGDWVPAAADHTQDNSFTGAFSFLMSINHMIEMANILNQTDDAETLHKLFDRLVNDFNKGFKKLESNGQYCYLDGYQESYVLPLALRAEPSDEEDNLKRGFLNSVENATENGVYVTGGIVTIRYIFSELSDSDASDVALQIAQRTDFPSYGFMFYNPYEPSSTLWELWNAYSQGPGMNSRNHHMFSSISAWLVTDMSGLSLDKGYDEIHFHPARALGLSHASVSLQYPKPMSLSWRRSGGIQCAKQAENRSPLNPNLPKNEDLIITCGQDGGTVAAVLFSSYGNPSGHCGGYFKLGSCHAPQSVEVVEKLCLGKRACTVPTGADFWGNPCPHSSRWLIVSVQCRSDTAALGEEEFVYSSISVNISIPMGSRGYLHLPSHGKQNMLLVESDQVVYSESSSLKSSVVAGVLSSNWDSMYNTMVVELDSGEYGFTWKGDNPHRRYLDSRATSTNELVLECGVNSTGIITGINWASFGDPEVKTSPRLAYSVGKCHAGSSKFVIKKKCLGKSKCIVPVDKSFFGKMPCMDFLEKGHLIVEYSCGFRYEYWKSMN